MKLLPWLLIALFVAGCRQGMYDQPRGKPYARNQFFDDRAMMRPLPPGVVVAGETRPDSFAKGSRGDLLLVESPVPLTRALLERGRERYEIYCLVCHGATGTGNGLIVQRGFPPPPSFHTERLRRAPTGHFVDVIAHGYGVMYPYAARVEPKDRWAIASYIRALQLSRNQPLTSVPAAVKAKLEAGR